MRLKCSLCCIGHYSSLPPLLLLLPHSVPNLDEDSEELKRARFIRCGRLWTQNTEEEEEEEVGGPFGFMLTAEELNRCSLGLIGFIIVIDDEVRPLLFICGFLLINRLSRVASSSLLVPPH